MGKYPLQLVLPCPNSPLLSGSMALYFSLPGLKASAGLDSERQGAFSCHPALYLSPCCTSLLFLSCSAEPWQNSEQHLVMKRGKRRHFSMEKTCEVLLKTVFLESP